MEKKKIECGSSILFCLLSTSINSQEFWSNIGICIRKLISWLVAKHCANHFIFFHFKKHSMTWQTSLSIEWKIWHSRKLLSKCFNWFLIISVIKCAPLSILAVHGIIFQRANKYKLTFEKIKTSSNNQNNKTVHFQRRISML